MIRHSYLRPIQLTLALFGLLLLSCPLPAQISGTGAISGTVHDPAGAVVPGASITATSLATGLARQATSSASGNFAIELLPPGSYRLDIAMAGFKTLDFPNVVVNVTQITAVNVKLTVGSTNQTVRVQATGQLLQTESSTLGSVVTGQMVRSLPLAVRNYTQIISLSPGVASEVTNAAEFGRGGGGNGGNATDVPVAAGTSFSENNYQMDGVGINNIGGSGYFTGGVAIPNPDTIAEFKVQTSQYDASYGRNAGANVNVVTKTGSNQFHGSVWEFFRNEALNANDYFRKQADQPRAILRQNQPGMTFGGPIVQDKVFFFLSYQSTRQQNGLDTQCSTVLNEPPLTNNRSAAALGGLFAGQPTFAQELGLGGPSVLPDGSNIAPQALALFNLKLPNGQYVIPTPQRIEASLPFDGQGVSVLSDACRFNEDQFMTNGDWNQSASSQWQVRFFFANSQQAYTFPAPNLGGQPAPGFPLAEPDHFRNLSIINNHIFSSNLLNQAEFGYHRVWVDTAQAAPFQYSDIGATVPSFDTLPAINFLGGISLGGNGQTVLLATNTFVYQDTVSWTHGNHAFRFGGGLTNAQYNLVALQYLAGMIFGTYPDALLGQSAAQNGTPLSNMYLSIDFPNEDSRKWRTLDYHGYAQDDYKVTPRLTLNLGFRYERVGDISDALGRGSNFNLDIANPNPPASGSLAGYVVASNFKGTPPPGVTRAPGKVPFDGDGQNTLDPRVGFAWQLPENGRVVLRGGYGIYHETLTGQPNLQLVLNPPYGQLRELVGGTNAAANWAQPFPPFTQTFPFFAPYSPSTALSPWTFANNFRPAAVQHYSLNAQTELARNTVLEVGYLGTRGQHLAIDRLPDQALSASPANPIRGQTDNTVANIALRLPVAGFSSAAFNQTESTGTSWYNALLANFTKRFQNGSEVQVAYTWSSSLSDTVGTATGPNGGVRTGDQNNPRADYGPVYFNRPNRLIANFVYLIPTPFRHTSLAGETLGGWTGTGVITVQSGHSLYLLNTNGNNAFGINGTDQDFAELTPNCSTSKIGTHGSVTSKLNNYFNTSCVTSTYPVIGADGTATGFGNSRPGMVRGPAQNNVDFALSKTFPFSVRSEQANILFRAETFNLFNTPQFSDPGNALDSPTFGVINTTSVAPRIMQLAVKISF
ncbi:MAG TPA: carboxypeptidase regulatory-like domain-containing protein [Acidobacteriaceae bacterium]|jgi:hypothetical protein|nr:carboxypeptidase regulatory-like domain-containing protein [Acidobacteriaceae bacterium]